MPELAVVLTEFGQRLAATGLPADAERIGLLIRAVTSVNPLDRSEVRAASRAIMCSHAGHVAVHDREFDRFFRTPGVRAQTPAMPIEVQVPTPEDDPGAGDTGQDDTTSDAQVMPQATASRTELLRQVDLGTGEQAQAALALMDRLDLNRPTRGGHRSGPATHGTPDLRRTVRELLRHEELGHLPRTRPRRRTRRVTVVIDVSASMDQWLPALLRFGRRAVTEADARIFAVGTRLTPLTAALRGPNAHAAQSAAHRVLPDAAGGTRLGSSLGRLIQDHRETVRGSVFVLVSDGWEQGGLDELDATCARLSRLAHRFVWINPRAGRTGFAPEVGGMRIAQARADALVPATTVADWQRACDLIAGERSGS